MGIGISSIIVCIMSMKDREKSTMMAKWSSVSSYFITTVICSFNSLMYVLCISFLCSGPVGSFDNIVLGENL